MKIAWANPWLDANEKNEINAAFDSTWLGMGPRTKEFEARMSKFIGVKHALAVSNGTDALDLALKALDIGPQDEVILPAMTYIATLSAVLYQYATPVFADIELETFNIDAASVKKKITPKTKCILYIDYGGNPADYASLKKVSQETGIPLLQDGAQSFGGEIDGEKLCKQGLISTTSFHIAKLLTTIEGGMVFTEDDGLAEKIRIMRNQGEDPLRKYIHVLLGTNARMTDLQAAIGLKQLDKIELILKKRAQIGEFYYQNFRKNKHIKFPVTRSGSKNAWFFVPIFVENRDRVVKELSKVGVDTRVAYPMPVYEQPFFEKYKKKNLSYNCPQAKWMTERVINLPIFYGMTREELDYVIDNTLKVVNQYAK